MAYFTRPIPPALQAQLDQSMADARNRVLALVATLDNGEPLGLTKEYLITRIILADMDPILSAVMLGVAVDIIKNAGVLDKEELANTYADARKAVLGE